MKTNPPLISNEKAEDFKRIGKQSGDILIIECLYNKNTLQEYYLFELDSKGKAKCFTNGNFDKPEVIDIKSMERNHAITYVVGFKKEKVSEIKEAIKYKQLALEYQDDGKIKKTYSDMEKKEVADKKDKQRSEKSKETIFIHNKAETNEINLGR